MKRPISTIKLLFALFIASLVLNVYILFAYTETRYRLNQLTEAFHALERYHDLVVSSYEEECGNRSDAPK